jgi:hypothetical protein
MLPDGTLVEHPGRHKALLCPGARAKPAPDDVKQVERPGSRRDPDAVFRN